MLPSKESNAAFKQGETHFRLILIHYAVLTISVAEKIFSWGIKSPTDL